MGETTCMVIEENITSDNVNIGDLIIAKNCLNVAYVVGKDLKYFKLNWIYSNYRFPNNGHNALTLSLNSREYKRIPVKK